MGLQVMASKNQKNAWTGQSASYEFIKKSYGDGSSHLSEMVSYDWRNKHPLPSGKHTKNYGKSQCFMGKLTLNGHVQ